MPISTKILIASIFGPVVAFMVAAAAALIEHWTGYNVFGFGVYLVVPVGAIATGAAAASGYFFVCRAMQMRPGTFLVIQMVFVAAITNLLIYYFEYLTLVWGDPLAFNLDVFALYLGDYLTHQQLTVGRGLSPVGEVGDFGYWLAVRDFVGFLVGGAMLVFTLRGEPMCPTCKLYYSRRAARNRFFHSRSDAAKYYGGLFALPLGGPEFAAKIALGEPKMSPAKGTVQVKTTLLHCPHCRQQRWQDRGEEWDGRAWKGLNEISRAILIQRGVDLSVFFEADRVEASQPNATPAQT